MTAHMVACACVLGPDATADPEVPVRLAEAALKGAAPAIPSPYYLNTLGAALYRAGRFDEAIRRLEEGIRLGTGRARPEDWAFLAMAHHRLGHRDEACRWLDRLRNHQPSADPTSSGSSWKSACCVARPRPWSSTIRRSPMTRSPVENWRLERSGGDLVGWVQPTGCHRPGSVGSTHPTTLSLPAAWDSDHAPPDRHVSPGPGVRRPGLRGEGRRQLPGVAQLRDRRGLDRAGRVATASTSSGRATRRWPWRSASARRSPGVGRWSCTKSVGMNVMIDPLMALNLTPVHGGLVILLGDDPGGYGSQNDQDTRPLAPMLEMPWLEPATPAEGFAMMRAAFDVSEQLHTAVDRARSPGASSSRSRPWRSPTGPIRSRTWAWSGSPGGSSPFPATSWRSTAPCTSGWPSWKSGPTRRPSTGSKARATSASSRPGSPIASCTTCSAKSPGPTSASSSWACSSPCRAVSWPGSWPAAARSFCSRRTSRTWKSRSRPSPTTWALACGSSARRPATPAREGELFRWQIQQALERFLPGFAPGRSISRWTKPPSVRLGRTTAPAAGSGRSSMR